MLATRRVDSEGPRKIYAIIREILAASSDASLSLLNISVQSPQNPLVKALKLSFDYDLRATNDPYLRVHRTRVGDLFVEDAYLYPIPNRQISNRQV